MYQKIFRPLLFQLDPEKAHTLTIQLLRLAGAVPPAAHLLRNVFSAHSQVNSGAGLAAHVTEKSESLAVEVFGLRFANPVGLAAGYDKDGLGWRGLAPLGFGHIELGTVTPRPQEGNPKPRVFRIPEEQAIINRMGFPGKGADFVAERLVANLPTLRPYNLPIIGVNIGKNKDTPNEEAACDYVYLYEKFSPLADYLAVNVSSPNTVGLRRLQARDYLEDLLKQLDDARHRSPVPRPILVKLAPDLTDKELDDALAAITTTGMDGVIATNTTIERERLQSAVGQEIGGLSGNPLTSKSLEIVQKIYIRTSGAFAHCWGGGHHESKGC